VFVLTHEENENQSKDDEVTVDFSKIGGFFSKYGILFLILIPILLSIIIRIQPYYLPVMEDSARARVYDSIQSNIEANILKQYPSLPAPERSAEVQKQFKQILKEQGPAIEQQVIGLSDAYKAYFTGDDGHPYLPDIDTYFWYKMAVNYVNNGHAGEVEKDGKSYDALMMGGKLLERGFLFHPFFESLIYKVVHVFDKDYTVMQAAFFIPLIFCALAMIPMFFLGKRIAGTVGGFVSATLAAVHPAIISRTSAGFSDTDFYHFFLPLTAVWLFVEGYYIKDLKKKIALFCGSALIMALHANIWGGWWYTPVFIITALFFVLVAELLKNIKNLRTFFMSSKKELIAFFFFCCFTCCFCFYLDGNVSI
jgi:hypothetical protein